MAHEKERELLEKFQDYWNERTTVFILAYDIDDFLSTLPEEKEEKKKIICPKLKACMSEPGVKCPDYDVICPV